MAQPGWCSFLAQLGYGQGVEPHAVYSAGPSLLSELQVPITGLRHWQGQGEGVQGVVHSLADCQCDTMGGLHRPGAGLERHYAYLMANPRDRSLDLFSC